jgi:hypothetical protein
MFFALHRMLVCQLPVPRAGQGISMDRLGNPQMIAGMQTPMLNGKFGFDVTLIEVVAAVVSERSWVQRAAAPLVAGGRIPDTVLVHCGPVIHHRERHQFLSKMTPLSIKYTYYMFIELGIFSGIF